MRFVAQSFPRLTRLSLAMCDSITNAALRKIASALPTCSTSSCSAAATSTTAASESSRSATQLRYLGVSWCYISDVGCRMLAGLRVSLTSIDLSGCASSPTAA